MKKILLTVIFTACLLQLVLGQGYSFSYSTLPICYGNSVVTRTLTSADLSPSEKAQDIYDITNPNGTYYSPSAVIVGDPTMTYNCHGFAWHMSRGGSTEWINEIPSKFWNWYKRLDRCF